MKTHEKIPKDFAVQPLKPGQQAIDKATCGHCGLSWDDGKPTSWTPTPAGRCPFEYFHLYPEDEMTKITEITRPFLRDARDEMAEALAEFGEKYGLTINVGSASYLPGPGGCATFKVELATQTADGEVNTKQAADFKRYASIYGFKPEDLYREFHWAGKTYKLVGFLPRSRRCPLLVERQPDGKQFKMPVEAAGALQK